MLCLKWATGLEVLRGSQLPRKCPWERWLYDYRVQAKWHSVWLSGKLYFLKVPFPRWCLNVRAAITLCYVLVVIIESGSYICFWRLYMETDMFLSSSTACYWSSLGCSWGSAKSKQPSGSTSCYISFSNCYGVWTGQSLAVNFFVIVFWKSDSYTPVKPLIYRIYSNKRPTSN